MAQAVSAFSNQQVPGEIYQQAAMGGLGELLAAYKPKYSNPLIIIGIALAGIIVDIVATVAIYAAGWIVFYLYIIPFLILAWAIYALASCNLRVYVFTSGFIRAKGRQGEVIRWDQIQAIWESVTRSSYSYRNTLTYTYTVQRNDGKIFKQGSPLQKSDAMGASIKREVVKIHLPLAKAAFQAGQTLSFGSINVDSQGVNNGKEMIPWNQIVRLSISQGKVVVEQSGLQLRWTAVKSAEVPNLSVLISLVNFVVQGQR